MVLLFQFDKLCHLTFFQPEPDNSNWKIPMKICKNAYFCTFWTLFNHFEATYDFSNKIISIQGTVVPSLRNQKSTDTILGRKWVTFPFCFAWMISSDNDRELKNSWQKPSNLVLVKIYRVFHSKIENIIVGGV